MRATPTSRFRRSRPQATGKQKLARVKPRAPKFKPLKRRLVMAEPTPPVSEQEELTLESDRRKYAPYDGNTALTLYMREVGKVALLTPPEEIKLAAKVKKGNAAARELMIRANLRLVVRIAREYEGLGLPLLDLINEGNIGLMKAVERFDPTKGGKLSTYGAFWIKQCIKRALANQSKTIRIPVHMVGKIARMRV